MLDHKEYDSTLELTFKGSMTIYRANEMAKDISQLNWHKEKIIIDLRNVDEIDTTGIQLLMMIAKSSKEFDSTMKITHGYSSQQTFEIMKLEQHLSQ
jgi:anti-anti-sigma regulatory factor